MTAIGEAVAHTPLWVFPVIAAVLWLGARNLATRQRSLRSLCILPAILLAVALVNLVQSGGALGLALPAFIVSLVIGGGIGWNLVPSQTVALPGRGLVQVPGSVVPLLIVIAVVILRYTVGYIYGRWPELRGDPALALELSATGALLAGIVWGRIARFTWIYRRI